jgi:alcohol dehydrogenase class IV
MTRFEFAAPTRIIFGAGTVREAGALAKGFGARALVATGVAEALTERLLESLRQQGVEAAVFPVTHEPEVATVERGVAQARRAGCQVVIGFGGGSAIDAAKAIAAMLANGGELLDYLEVIGRGQALARPSVPFLAIPTTAGTGAEVTRNAVLASPPHRVKVSLRGLGMLAKVALIDPELTYDLPPAVTASTGLDALTQVLEPYVCARANPMTDALCVEGLRRAARSLRAAFADGRNAAAREDMAVASLFGGLALANAGLGGVHGFAAPIGGMFPAPHGAVCAALLAPVMEVNVRALRERQPASPALVRYDEVARLLAGDPRATAEQGAAWLRQLVADLRIPRLGAYGLTRAHVPGLVEKAARASSMKPNPVPLTPEELNEILARAM